MKPSIKRERRGDPSETRGHGRRTRGFSLIEVVVSMLLLAVAVLVFVALYPSASKSSRMTSRYTQALGVVQHKVDQLRAFGYGRLNFTDLRQVLSIDATPTTCPYRFDGVDQVSSVLPGAVGTITVTDVGANLREVVVAVSWGGSGIRAAEGSHAVTLLVPNE